MLMQRHLWNFFWGICVLIALVLIVRVWNLRLLYIDKAVREQVRTTIEVVAGREGWLISDISLRAVQNTGVMIHHRQHMRGSDPRECYFIAFETLNRSPCIP
ncbi:MAG: hypothetical protein Greene041662_415 [Candidatus Peregrinibacteria bacterium Greene0416_62]|nr:MAG: hypothetical protein Greene041662_415 [Candidatus Peregrinibacteria bacterium Greene0416_62]TSD00433.1 MAG: hypothetical protein Greene101449_152 [Candidatus Peregrinibacteria bacterium Greene1014_49]